MYTAESDIQAGFHKRLLNFFYKFSANQDLYLLELPPIIKSKNEIKIVHYYLNKLFNCSYDSCDFDEFIFNPNLIQLLFGNAKQFYVQNCILSNFAHNIEHLFQFILNNLVGETLAIEFYLDKDILEKYRDTLFKILMIRGNNFKKVHLKFYNTPEMSNFLLNVTMLYEHIVEYIAISRDCSTIVSEIILDYSSPTSLKLCERAEKVEIKQLNRIKFTKYQISNIHNSKAKYSVCNKESHSAFSDFDIQIRIIKEYNGMDQFILKSEKCKNRT
ncbi:unnamed protein product [Meloidogyne enterolobii]|uniref:Uncharacterized protein n=2 Tax=Meloidogyne enterolobii TaxID=390850 RepID=A0ACB0YSY4_MELEN